MPVKSADTDLPPRRRIRLVSRTATLSLTLAVIGGAGGAVWQGAALLAERAEAAEAPPAATPVPVATRTLTVEEGYSVERRFTGQIAPAQATDLSFELPGRIVEIMVDEGAPVGEGQPLARLDTALLETEASRLEAAREALAADLDFAEQRLVRQEELKARGFSPDEALDEAQARRRVLSARIAENDAQIANVRVRLEKSILRAPYAGTIAARPADTGATVAPGAPVLRLTETGAAELRVGLPLWVSAEPDTEWTVEIGDARRTGTVTALLPEVDPATRTRTALLRLEGADAPWGATADLVVSQRIEAAGAWVPRASLREGAPGVWTVLAVDAERIVRTMPVEVLHVEGAQVYVSGPLTPGLSLIEGGPHRIVPGQTVAPLATPAKGA